MYYHKTSAFEKPAIISSQELQPGLENESKINWGRLIVVAGMILIAGIFIGRTLKNINWPRFKKNEPENNQ
jgi:hypothetical protein